MRIKQRLLLAAASLALVCSAACSSDSISGPEPVDIRKNSGLMGSGG